MKGFSYVIRNTIYMVTQMVFYWWQTFIESLNCTQTEDLREEDQFNFANCKFIFEIQDLAVFHFN